MPIYLPHVLRASTMNVDPYWCGICDLTFKSEKESYEHDVSIEHHERYELSQRALKQPVVHFCSLCDAWGMTGINSWKGHLEGKRHKASLKYFYQYYSDKNHSNEQNPTAFIKKQSHSVSNATKGKKRPPNSGAPGQTYSAPQRVKLLSGESKKPANLTERLDLVKTTDEAKATAVIQPQTSTQSVAKLDSSQSAMPSVQGGLMLNILETVGPDMSEQQVTNATAPKRIISSRGRGAHSRSDSNWDRQRADQKNLSHSVSLKAVRTMRESPKNKHPRRNSLSLERIDVSSTVEEVPSAPSSPNVHATPEAGGDLKRMQEALELSHKLETLKVKQRNLEKQIEQLQTTLNEVRTERRDVKIRRKNLLRGLAQSDSEEENGNRRPSLPTDLSGIPNSVVPDRLSSERQVASVAPVTVSSRSSEPLMCPPLAVNSVTTLNRNIADTQPTNDLSASSRGFTAAPNPLYEPGLSSRTRTPHTFHDANQPVPPAPSLPLPSRETHLLPNPPTVENASNTSGLDLERLALIRQAIQSPDSWQFTFEQVDQMLKQTAAKAAATSRSNPTTSGVAEHPPAPLQSSTVVPPKHTTQLIKGEPPDTFASVPTNTGNLVAAQPLSTEQPPAPSVPSKVAGVSAVADSTDSSEDGETASHVIKPLSRKPPKIRKIVKSDPTESALTATQSSIHQPVVRSTESAMEHLDSTESLVTPPCSPPTKQPVKYGEFHAFDGGTAAVIDMIVHRCTSSVFIGGQNGMVVQFDLKTHERVKHIASRDASVTKMAVDPQERSLFTAYYDNHLAEYNVQTGMLLWEKSFSNRVEALATAPLSDVPFLFLGMSNGDILRHHMADRTTSVLFSQIPVCAISSMAAVRSGARLFLLVGHRDCSLFVREASDGSLVRCITSAPHKGPPGGITGMPCGSNFCSYSERALRIHNWKTGVGVLTLQTQKITSCCVLQRYIAVGDSEGTVRVYKIQHNGLPGLRPTKVYYASHRSAITSLISCGVALISGGLDGTVTLICITEPVNNYTCLYGPFGHHCGIGFESRKDLVSHVMDTHLIFGNQKSVMCRWGAGRCRTRFTDTQSIKAISDHLLTHIPD